MLTEGRNYGISDMLKTVYPTKIPFCGWHNKVLANISKLTVSCLWNHLLTIYLFNNLILLCVSYCYVISCWYYHRLVHKLPGHLNNTRTKEYLSRSTTKPTKLPVHPGKTQISVRVCLVWSGSLMSAWWRFGFFGYPYSSQGICAVRSVFPGCTSFCYVRADIPRRVF